MWFSIVVLCFFSCRKIEPQIILVDDVKSNIVIDASQKTTSIKFNSTTDWNVSIEGDDVQWCSLSSSYGQAGDAEIIITSKINESFNHRISQLL